MEQQAQMLDEAGGEDRPLRELLRLAGPTIAQMASYTVMQFLDTWMLSHVGDRVTPADRRRQQRHPRVLVIALGMGVLWVVNTLVSQSYGRKDYSGCGRYLWQGVWFSLVFAVLVFPFLPLAPRGFLILGHETDLARQEAAYLQILVSFAAVKLVGTTFGQFLLAVDRAKYVMFATVAGVAVNAVAAWMLIFHYSFGVVGAAWGQNIGVTVESLLCIGFAMFPAVRNRFNVLDWRLRWEQMRTL